MQQVGQNTAKCRHSKAQSITLQ